jgi:hypothetical protein
VLPTPQFALLGWAASGSRLPGRTTSAGRVVGSDGASLLPDVGRFERTPIRGHRQPTRASSRRRRSGSGSGAGHRSSGVAIGHKPESDRPSALCYRARGCNSSVASVLIPQCLFPSVLIPGAASSIEAFGSNVAAGISPGMGYWLSLGRWPETMTTATGTSTWLPSEKRVRTASS